MELRSRNIFLDTQVFCQKNFNFNDPEFQSLMHFSAKSSIKIYITDIVHLEIVEKIRESISDAYKKLNMRDTQSLKSIPLYTRFLNVYSEDKARHFLEDKFSEFIKCSDVEIIHSGNVNVLNIYRKYVEKKPPFHQDKSKKNRKGEFPDSFSLEAILNWCIVNREKAYLISGDSDWSEFSKSSPFYHPDCLHHAGSLSEVLDAVNRNESDLRDTVIFADKIVSDNLSKIYEAILKSLKRDINFKLKNENYSYIEISEFGVIDLNISDDEIIFTNKDEAKYNFETLVNVIVNYNTSLDHMIGNSPTIASETTYKKHVLKLGCNVHMCYPNGIPGEFNIKSVVVPAVKEIDFDKGVEISIQDWNMQRPVIICGVENNEITKDGTGTQEFKSFNEAKEIFPTLIIDKGSKDFTIGFKSSLCSPIRFETWKANELYSS